MIRLGKFLAFWIAGHGDYYHNSMNEDTVFSIVAGQNSHPLPTNN